MTNVNRVEPSANIVRILVVDDLRVIKEKLKSILAPHPDLQIVGTAPDGETALEQIEYLQPDLVLLDLDMPKLDGFEVLVEISRQYPDIQAIIISSLADVETRDRAMKLGAKAYIIKDRIALKIVDEIRNLDHLDRNLMWLTLSNLINSQNSIARYKLIQLVS